MTFPQWFQGILFIYMHFGFIVLQQCPPVINAETSSPEKLIRESLPEQRELVKVPPLRFLL